MNGQPEKHPIVIAVNGEKHGEYVEPRMSLSDFLRDKLGLTGTHIGCHEGACGACTVLLDGVSARSCLTLATQADGRQVDTVESLVDDDGRLTLLQEAFVRRFALQCGFCTPGFLMLATEIVKEAQEEGRSFSREALTERLSANLCRCTGYVPIVEAVEEVLRTHSDSNGGERA
ncbi:carbon-monoxide dehydrogenase small subunit [Haloechinothrix alba]|uniref:Carbon-monoxide dehydrogenase small subunit n=1 Tax=Haloechinothrix alba TaxID=664784 RepID=A0A238ZZX0_9PSEU|nr:(2Fe-2S)-binding protein [Haloechinothrix alba]SNR88937.1 carbon-monoxide dehydrogenase small subunit [Haloechinothrix alba]